MQPPPMPRVPSELLDRYFAGLCTPDEVARVEAAIAQNPHLSALTKHVAGHAVDVSSAWSRFVQQGRMANAPATATRHAGLRTETRRSFRYTLGIGLVAGVALVAGLFSMRSSARTHEQARTYATGAGRRATITLADGSRIVLAPNTTVRLTEDATHHARTVSLIGEAHFDVIASAHTPFVVQTGRVATSVLGTTFDVRRYVEDRVGRVAVISGKVRTASDGTVLQLSAGMAAQFTDSTVTPVAGDVREYTDWTRGRLVFRDAPVAEVLSTLRRWYGYDFRVTDSTLVRQTVTAVFTIGETAEMLRVVRHMLGVGMVIRDSVITLRPLREGQADSDATSGTTRDQFTHQTMEVGR